MKKPMRKSLVVVLALIMAFAMSTSAFADTTSWTSFQGNDQNNGVITGTFSTEPTWDAVPLLDYGKGTGWSGVDCQPLMTTESGKTYAYVVTDSKVGPKAFKVDCEEKRIADGWSGCNYDGLRYFCILSGIQSGSRCGTFSARSLV